MPRPLSARDISRLVMENRQVSLSHKAYEILDKKKGETLSDVVVRLSKTKVAGLHMRQQSKARVKTGVCYPTIVSLKRNTSLVVIVAVCVLVLLFGVQFRTLKDLVVSIRQQVTTVVFTIKGPSAVN